MKVPPKHMETAIRAVVCINLSMKAVFTVPRVITLARSHDEIECTEQQEDWKAKRMFGSR